MVVFARSYSKIITVTSVLMSDMLGRIGMSSVGDRMMYMSVSDRGATLAASSMSTDQPRQNYGDRSAPSLWQEQPDLRVLPNAENDGRGSRRLVGTWSTGRRARCRADS